MRAGEPSVELSQLERLRLIIKAFRYCEEEPTMEAVGVQYRRETGEEMDREAFEKALK